MQDMFHSWHLCGIHVDSNEILEFICIFFLQSMFPTPCGLFRGVVVNIELFYTQAFFAKESFSVSKEKWKTED